MNLILVWGNRILFVLGTVKLLPLHISEILDLMQLVLEPFLGLRVYLFDLVGVSLGCGMIVYFEWTLALHEGGVGLKVILWGYLMPVESVTYECLFLRLGLKDGGHWFVEFVVFDCWLTKPQILMSRHRISSRVNQQRILFDILNAQFSYVLTRWKSPSQVINVLFFVSNTGFHGIGIFQGVSSWSLLREERLLLARRWHGIKQVILSFQSRLT